MLAAESLLVDQKDPQAAIDALAILNVPENNRFMRFQRATLQADAYEAAGQRDQAVAALENVLSAIPNPRLQERLDRLKGGAGSPAP
jgi:hypothetical protein